MRKRLLMGDPRIYIYRTDKKESDSYHSFNKLVGRITVDDKCEATGFEVVSRDLIEETLASLDCIAYFKNVNNKYVKPNMESITRTTSGDLTKNLSGNKKTNIKNLEMKAAYLTEKSKIKHVEQGKYGIISGNDDGRYIETTGLGPCVGICIWNAKTHDVGIIHIDTDETYQLLPKLFEKIQGKDKDYLEVSIIGGGISGYNPLDEGHTKPLLNKCKKFFEDRGMKIKTYDVLNKKIIDLVMLDKETGTLLVEKSNKKISELRRNIA